MRCADHLGPTPALQVLRLILAAADAAVIAGLEDAAAADAQRVADVISRYDLQPRQPRFFERAGRAWDVLMGRAPPVPLPRAGHQNNHDNEDGAHTQG